ncbi:hypothetical protein ROJ8625_03773 [Roseivivax jejudonensis]|uniref:Uncharacterized protein n=1 Tax=Roseivivax jejudonensis TaxID=1529041 RepID=A0A1X7A7B9_9RHOB|nr:hypothetical protein [Roseivivax jejudonensis]SLN72015.1 hypothetical protein ROJ8625_03773 [Roseivivax jejudonensis]
MAGVVRINRSELMRLAWMWARQEQGYTFIYNWTPGPGYGHRRAATGPEKRAVFAECLRRAWAEMKARVARLAAHAANLGELGDRSASSLRAEIRDIETRNRIGPDGWKRLSQLQAALRMCGEASEPRPLRHAKRPQQRVRIPRTPTTASAAATLRV